MRLTTIKLQRLRTGLLQVELAHRAHIARCRLSEIENGHLTARADELQRLASVLGVPVQGLSEPASDHDEVHAA